MRFMKGKGRSLAGVFLLAGLFAAAESAQAAMIKVACVQMRLSNNLSTNVTNVVASIASEAAQGTRVVVFSEFALTDYDPAAVPDIPQSEIDNALDQVADACAAHHVYAIVGTPYFENNVCYNAAVVLGPDGQVIERYYKIHVVESYTTDGNRLALFNIDGVPATIFICHDERYPELMRIPVLGGARIAFYISYESEAASGKNFNYRCQIVGRAVENQTWVVTCNAPVGNDSGSSHGQSRIIGPDGTVHQEAGDAPTAIRHIIDTSLSSNAWAQAGAMTPLLDQFWTEGLRALQAGNLDVFGSVTADPFLQPNVGVMGSSPNANPKIACVQMQMAGDVAANAAKIVSFISSEAAQGTRVVVFPECALTDRNPAALPGLSQSQLDAAIGQIASACDAANVYAIVGSPFRQDGQLCNGAFVIDPAGAIIKRYAQLHTDLPAVFAEGNNMSLFRIDGVYATVMVGHDIHFPELSRIAILAGSKLNFYLAYEPAGTSLYASESQVVCRSAESQSFTIFCNAGTGNSAGNSTGHSRFVGPSGNVPPGAEAGTAGDTVIRYTVNTAAASSAYPQAGAGTPSLSAYWHEGLDVLRINNPEFYGDEIVPPVITEVSPDPGQALAGLGYVQQLALEGMSLPAPAWVLLEKPSGAQVDRYGRVSWTPDIGQNGQLLTFRVQAANEHGSDDETWQVRVLSRGDLDSDADVDQSDFGLFQACISGNGAAHPADCTKADLSGDGDVDEQDLSAFLDCVGGPNASPRG
jgi:predicted amidohydrolase